MVPFSLALFAQIGSVQFVTAVSADTVYAGAQVTYEGSIRLNTRTNPRFLSPPEYIAPKIHGTGGYALPFDTLTAIRTVPVDGVPFRQYTYRHAFFPMTPGIDTISAASVQFTLVNEADPYASKATTITSAPRYIVVLPLPIAGRPADFSGAVGQLTVARIDDPSEWHVGTSRTVRIRVSGSGHLALLPRPVLTIPWATVIATSDSTVWDAVGTVIHGFKEFRWLVTPRSGGAHAIPAIQYTYFDPKTVRYVAATTDAVPVGVSGTSLVISHDTLTTNPFPTLIQSVLAHPVVAAVVGIVLLVLLGVVVTRLQRRAAADALNTDTVHHL